jgi:hypothetical protein
MYIHVCCQTSEFCFHLINSAVIHGRCKILNLIRKSWFHSYCFKEMVLVIFVIMVYSNIILKNVLLKVLKICNNNNNNPFYKYIIKLFVITMESEYLTIESVYFTLYTTGFNISSILRPEVHERVVYGYQKIKVVSFIQN